VQDQWADVDIIMVVYFLMQVKCLDHNTSSPCHDRMTMGVDILCIVIIMGDICDLEADIDGEVRYFLK